MDRREETALKRPRLRALLPSAQLVPKAKAPLKFSELWYGSSALFSGENKKQKAASSSSE